MKEEEDRREEPDEKAPLRAAAEKRCGDRPGRGGVVCKGQVLVTRSYEDKMVDRWGRSGGTGFELAD